MTMCVKKQNTNDTDFKRGVVGSFYRIINCKRLFILTYSILNRTSIHEIRVIHFPVKYV